MSFLGILEKYRAFSFSERDKGARFERLMRSWLMTAPLYSDSFTAVWLWQDFPYRASISMNDVGIDLVAKTVTGEYWAIQCKCYSESATINKPEVDSFLATSSREFMDSMGQSRAFAKRLWISTTNKWGPEAEKAIANQKPEVLRIGLNDLINSPVDWEKLEKGTHGTLARLARKQPREHQKSAIGAFHQHFEEGNQRGKLIMACGTGKTFTSLKIAEKEAGPNGLVLFLAPSISLVAQTLREWAAEAEEPIWPICVCSDPTVSQIREQDSDGERIIDLAWPASTSPESIVSQLKMAAQFQKKGLTVVFSTYQSIERVSAAQKQFGREFDLIICDEAHRTTGVSLQGKDESAFLKVHDNSFLRAAKRVYMTATPRIYAPEARQKAKENLATVCSMDDESLYGEEVFRIGFGEAVDRQLLAEYKVLVFTITQKDIPPEIMEDIASREKLVNLEDASKLIGCINALSKRKLIDYGWLKSTDPAPMRKAVAFCQTIKRSKQIAGEFNEYQARYRASLPEESREELINVQARHVDGTMGAVERAAELEWLNASPAEGNECRIITNVRCLSEGVDVPSLDAILFLSSRDSQIDVVQSVGRVMRTAPGKKYGYIIIPVLVPEDEQADLILDNNERFKTVWTVLAALRAHDDRFVARVRKIELNERRSAGRQRSQSGGRDPALEERPPADGFDPASDDNFLIIGGFSDGETRVSLERLASLQEAVFAKMVAKVGNRRYWEQWASDVAEIARRYSERISRLIATPGPHQRAFSRFLAELQESINPSLSQVQAVEMLSQHYITRPVFEALFENYSFVAENPVSRALQEIIGLLEEQALEKDTLALSRFYQSVRMSVSRIDNPKARQKIITELYDKFFRTAFPLTVQQLGIVYTPVEIVDFINQSVADILQKHFRRSLSDADVNVLDPFTGTGTFIARLIESGLISREALPAKYRNSLFANEIILLAYYIASINIENAYHAAMGNDSRYQPFNGICLADTFQLGEKGDQAGLDPHFFRANSERIQREEEKAIQVIIGNPPYSIGQRSANDNAQNQSYPQLDQRIAQTYAAASSSNLKRALYDSYIKAFRWASDRIDHESGGIIAFVCNAGWLDGNATDGLRKALTREFDAIYIFNLRGNQRTAGELSRREGGKIFGSGSRTPVCIAILVREPGAKRSPGKEAVIHYRDIGDYLSREEKLKIIAAAGSALSPEMNWQELTPDANGDWLAHRNEVFASFIPLGDKAKGWQGQTFFKPVYSLGLATNRDAWCYNFSQKKLAANIRNAINFFNAESGRIAKLGKDVTSENVMDFVNADPEKFSWDRQQRRDLVANKRYGYSESRIFNSLYRPFSPQKVYFSRQLNNCVYQLPQIFPSPESENLLICVSGVAASKDFSCLISDKLPNLDTLEKAQCFPLYYYEEASHSQPTLMDSGAEKSYTRRDGLTDFILEEAQQRYGRNVKKEDIFYYVHGLLHSPQYREKFATDLKKSLPALPLLERPADFWSFSRAGRSLANLHLNYENQPAPPGVQITGAARGNYGVTRMRFANKGDKTAIIYNEDIAITDIPAEAYEYVVNGRSAIEWVMERYQIRTDKASGLVNDPNDWAREHDNPRYILDLLLSVISVSLETVKIVAGLPQIDF